ncbi:MAG: hypothetical protein ACR2MT_03735 [Aurantibacter sp.]
MKDIKTAFKNNPALEKKFLRIQKQIASKYWVGWAGGYGTPKKR